MKLLCIDTSNKELSISLVTETEIHCKYNGDCKLLHSQILLGEIELLLQEHSIRLKDIDCFCAVIGPGSFTGIRIGITTVRAFAQIFGKPVVAVNSLEVKSYNVRTKHKYIVPLVDAMQNKVYFAVYDSFGKELHSADVCEEATVSETVRKLLNAPEKAILFIYEKIFNIDADVLTKFDICGNMSRLCKDKFLAKKTQSYQKMLPLYAVLSQAERNYENSHK